MPFEVGQTVVHPHHGAAVVDQFEERELDGEVARYVVLRLEEADLTLKVPSGLCEEVGIREVIDADAVTEIMDVLSDEPDTSNKHWARRLKRNQRRMRSGDPEQVAEVIRDLCAKEELKGLSPAEKRLRDQAMLMLCGELAAAADVQPERAEEMIDEAIPDVTGADA